MPYLRELEVAIAAAAIWRRWPSDDRVVAEALLEELGRLANGRRGDWIDIPLRDPAAGYAEWAESYDLPGNWLVELDSQAMAEILAAQPPGAALDAACGTGRHAAFLASRGHTVVGVDASEAMLARARARVPEATFLPGELAALPLDDGSVDLAVCSLALTHVEELAPAVAELARVVRAGGGVVLSDVHPCCVLLGGQALYRSGSRDGYVRNHLHWHGAYLTAFRAAGLEVEGCLDVALRREETDAISQGLDVAPELAAEALLGVPAVLIWQLRR